MVELSPRAHKIQLISGVVGAVIVILMLIVYPNVTQKNLTQLETIKDRGYVRFLTLNSASTYYQNINETNGFEYQLGRLFGKFIGVEAKFITVSHFADLYPELLFGSGDIIAAGLSKNESSFSNAVLYGPEYYEVTNQILFRKDHPISERVIFPVSESERKGIEDARFVRFVADDGTVTYYATYAAYNGETILPQLIQTCDFLSFTVITLNGAQVQGKGMALFPRKIGGKYVMLSRQDGENNAIMFSDNLHFWQQAQLLQEPEFPYEFIQMGNGGSPMETPEGWLVVTHGVGPLRTYSLGIELLDLEDPTRIISRIDEPILVPNAHEREGYVPNVVYSCGAMIHQDELIIPYASGDQRCGIATLQVPQLMARLTRNSRVSS